MNIRKLASIVLLPALLMSMDSLQAQESPSRQFCIILGMLGVSCEELEGGDDNAAPAGSAGEAYVSHAKVFSLLPDSFLEIVPRSSSTLHRSAGGLTGVLSLASQLPNQATTLWWVIYNHPEYCETTPCTFDDFAIPEVGASFFTTGGRVSDRFGHVYLDGVVFAGAGRPGPEEPQGLGEGLTNPLGAEVHLASRTHGQDADALAEEGILEEALSTLFGGGCPFDTLDLENPEQENPNGCTDPTITFHLSPQID